MLEIVGLGKAAELARQQLQEDTVLGLRDEFWRLLQDRLGEYVVLNGHPTELLPNTLSVGFRGCRAQQLLARMPEVAASTGSACHSDSDEPSSILTAMGLPDEVAHGTLRFSLGRGTTREELEFVANRLEAIVHAASKENAAPNLDFVI